MIPAGLKRDDSSSHEEEEDDDPPKKQSSNVTTTTTTTNNNKKKNTSRVTFQTTTETNKDEDKKYISTDSTHLLNNNNNNYKTNHEDDNNHPSRNTISTSSSSNMEEKECSTTNSNVSRQPQNHEASSSLVTILVERIRQETQELYPDTNASIADPDLILHLLQLSAGDIQVAMDFFWDHYLATASTIASTTTTTTTTTTNDTNNQVHKRKRSHPPMAAAAKKNDDEDDNFDDADEEDEESSTRRIRLEQNNPPPNNENVPMPPLHEQPLLPPPAPIRNLPLNDDQLMDNNNEIQNNNNNDPNPQPPQNIQDAAEILDADENQDPIVESVSISDDEGVWRMERRQRPFIPGLYAQRNHRIRPESNDYSIQPFANLESQPPQPVASDQEAPDDDDDDDGDDMDDDSTYISEDDWCTSNSTGINTKQDPSKILWGRNSNNRTTTGSNPAPNHDDANNNNNAAPSAEAATPPIPRTWMYAGFQMAKDGGGLTLKPPSDDELIDQLYQLQQQNVGGKKLPFHCKSLTIILSIVQAIMLTGATVQVNTVDCTSLQTSFAELSQDQRIQQFNRRLEDAIVALLFVAIQASTARKQRIIQNRQNKKRHRAGSKTSKNDNRINQDFELMQHQRMTRRLRLCPTCQWSEDSVPTEGSQDSNSHNPIQVITTLTHRSDLRYYVKSNLKQFQSSRGCALLLETIVRIHGQGTVDQMIRKSRRKCGLSMDHFHSLITCTCHADSLKTSMASNTNKTGAEMRNTTNHDNEEKEEKEKDEEEKDEEEKEKDTHKDVDVVDSAPFHRQECASIELMSLLICGEVHSTFHGWSSGPLGFGILSKLEDISDDLTKPFKPVWILRGDLVHSLAWVPTEKLPIHFDIDQPGAIFPVSHWNPWYEPILPKLSHFRIHIQRTQWTPPTTITPSSTLSHRETQHKSIPGMFVKKKSGKVENKDNKTNATQMPITIQSNPKNSRHCNIIVEHHPDDLRFYPDTYHRWRFQFHDPSNSNNSLTTTTTTTTTNEDDDPIRLSIWIFYSSLTSQERDIVDSKWAPPIHTILKSRWPKCIIDTLEHAS